MRAAGPRGQASSMTDSTANPPGFGTNSGPRTDSPFGPQAGQNFLRRPFQGRMLAGVPLYLAGLLLIPDEGSDQSIASSLLGSR
jgi:hypothetical protein